MPRHARIDIPGLLQHVIVRGIERRDIFLDDDDRHLFLDRLAKLLLETGTDCLAWALMDNHFHLLLRPRQSTLAIFMRRLLTGYAVVFNLRHQRSGHLFQNRYKSIVCQEDLYLLELVRYIHLNPLRAGLVKSVEELEAHPWSGHHIILGKGKLDGQNPDEILSLFGRKRASARRAYRKFVVDGIKKGRRDELVGGGLRRSAIGAEPGDWQAHDARILGSGEFVEGLRQEAEAAPSIGARIALTELIHRTADLLGVEAELLPQRSRNADLAGARAVICYLATRRYGFSGVEVAKALNMTRSGVSVAIRRGAETVRRTPELFPES